MTTSIRRGVLRCGSTALLALALWQGAAWAHGPQGHGQHHALGPFPVLQTPFGIAGHPKRLRRTIVMELREDMRLVPGAVRVKEGDTIRFVLRNTGRMHLEWTLGTDEELERQRQARRSAAALPGEVHVVHVDAGESAEIVWLFNRRGTFRLAALNPGRAGAGGQGTVTVEPLDGR